MKENMSFHSVTPARKTKQDNLIMYGLAIIYENTQFIAQKGFFFLQLNKPPKGMITNDTELLMTRVF